MATRGMTIAALLIRTSSLPNRLVAVLTALCQSASLVTSRWTYTASRPAARMAASTFWPSASRMSPKTTLAPSLANVSASAAPCPRAPPLISATFPSSFPISISCSAYEACLARPVDIGGILEQLYPAEGRKGQGIAVVPAPILSSASHVFEPPALLAAPIDAPLRQHAPPLGRIDRAHQSVS